MSEAYLLLPCEAGEVSAKPTEGASPPLRSADLPDLTFASPTDGLGATPPPSRRWRAAPPPPLRRGGEA